MWGEQCPSRLLPSQSAFSLSFQDFVSICWLLASFVIEGTKGQCRVVVVVFPECGKIIKEMWTLSWIRVVIKFSNILWQGPASADGTITVFINKFIFNPSGTAFLVLQRSIKLATWEICYHCPFTVHIRKMRLCGFYHNHTRILQGIVSGFTHLGI